MVLTPTGAVPLRVIKLRLVLKVVDPLTAKFAATVVNWPRMKARRWASQLVMAVMVSVPMPLATSALYLAVSIGVIFAGSMGPFTASSRARQKTRRNGG